MQIPGKIREKIQSRNDPAALLFVFGTPAHANVTASPTTVSFGTQAVGTTSAPVTVTVTNTGNRVIKIGSASVSRSQFSYSGPSLPITLNRGQSLTASVRFAPTAAQAYSGTLTFTRNNGQTTSVGLSGTGSQTSTSTSAAVATATSTATAWLPRSRRNRSARP